MIKSQNQGSRQGPGRSIICMKPKPAKPAINFDRDMQVYERLPDRAKELSRLKDEAEKSSGPVRIELDKKIRTKSG
jgi:hypothetical protein